MQRLIIAFVLLGGLITAAPAQTPAHRAIAVESAWARATPKGAKTGAVYLTLVNHGAQPDRLIALETPVAQSAQLHTETNDHGIMKMRPLDALEVAPGATVALKPGGTHVMLVGLKQPLREGETFPLTLAFAQAGRQHVQVTVAKVGAMGGAHEMSGRDTTHMGH